MRWINLSTKRGTDRTILELVNCVVDAISRPGGAKRIPFLWVTLGHCVATARIAMRSRKKRRYRKHKMIESFAVFARRCKYARLPHRWADILNWASRVLPTSDVFELVAQMTILDLLQGSRGY